MGDEGGEKKTKMKALKSFASRLFGARKSMGYTRVCDDLHIPERRKRGVEGDFALEINGGLVCCCLALNSRALSKG